MKISLESKSLPAIIDATNEYFSIPSYTVWRTSFTINSNYARTDGKVDSTKGGTQSYTHTFTARYKYVEIYNMFGNLHTHYFVNVKAYILTKNDTAIVIELTS